MKKLILLSLAAIPLFAFGVNFIIADYEYYGDEYYCDEYWCDCPYDGYWVYYPDGCYCVHYVWWYPWWWDWYWQRCHWCHHFCWDFFYSGFYIVWYEDGYWWWRPRYGRAVRHRLPYTYREIRYRAKKYGIILPRKPPRKINVPYKENKIKRLIQKKDPELFSRVVKEHKSGNLEKMRKVYDAKIRKNTTLRPRHYLESSNRTKIRDSNHNILPGHSTEDIRTPHRKYKNSENIEKEGGIHIIKKKKKKSNDIDYKRSEKESGYHFKKIERHSIKKSNHRTQPKIRLDKDDTPGRRYIHKKVHPEGQKR